MSYIFVSENVAKAYIFGSIFLPVQVCIFGFSHGRKLIFLDKFREQQRGIELKYFIWLPFNAIVFHTEM